MRPHEEKQFPNNIEAERHVLGCILADPTAFIEVASILAPHHFYRDQHQHIYQVMVDLAGRHLLPDIDMIHTELELRGKDKIIPWSDLHKMAMTEMEAYMAKGKLDYYAQLVRKTWERRELVKATYEIASKAFDEDADDAVADASALINAIAQNRSQQSDVLHIDALDEYMAKLNNLHNQHEAGMVVGVPTGFKKLDAITGGWRKEKSYIIAARPGKGKSAMALNFADTAVKNGCNVLFFSLEMDRDELMQRWVSMNAKVDSMHLRDGNIDGDAGEWDRIMEAEEKLRTLPNKLIINDDPRNTDQSLRAIALSHASRYSIDLIIIDYLQRVSGTGVSERKLDRRLEVEQVSRNITCLARELHVPVITLAQLNREVESRASKEPELSDLKEASGIEQDADLVSFIYELPNQPSETEYACQLLIKKHRNGPRGNVDLYYQGKFTKFYPRETNVAPTNQP